MLQAVVNHSGPGSEDSVMDEGNTATTTLTRRGLMALPGRRKLAVVAILIMLGAIIIDPAMINDVRVSDLPDNNLTAESKDEFAQIERMLAQIDAANAVLSDTTSGTQTVGGDLPEESGSDVPSEFVSGPLVIPAPTAPAPASDAKVAASLPVAVKSRPPVSGVSFPGEVKPIEGGRLPPSVASGSPNAVRQGGLGQQSLGTARIRLTGTIDPIQ